MSDAKMRWNCDRDGCFNRRHRLKFDTFYDCLPGKTSFSDIDGIAEVGGQILIQEWKSNDSLRPDSPNGQLILAKRMSALSPSTFVFVCGNAENMQCSAVMTVKNGAAKDWEPCGISQLKERIKAWASRAVRRITG